MGKVLVYEKDIKDKWKKYFYKLFDDGYEILSDSKILTRSKRIKNRTTIVELKPRGKVSVEKDE